MIASVIIPSYKRSAQLTDCVNSLFRQEFPNNQFEIVVVDNSTEQIPELKSFFAANIHHSIRYLHEPKNGLHNARHAGARAARGDILVYIDDDVVCPPNWLSNMLVPYKQSNADMVAGKVILKYENKPPDWLTQFSGLLSAFDLGATPHRILPPGSFVGCNMSMKKSVLYELGGFNPDGFGDKSLIKYRGDGECGLTHKAHQHGKLIWYEPAAWLWHKVPVTRLTEDYVFRRESLNGIEEVFGEFRYGEKGLFGISMGCLKSAIEYLYHIVSLVVHSDPSARIKHLATASRKKACFIQRLRLMVSSELRSYCLRKSYMD